MAAILSRPQCVNTLRPRQNGRHFPDDIFEWIFWNENVWISINISLKFVPRGPINNIPTLLQVMTWRRPGDKPWSEPMMVKLTTHICVTRPQWVKNWRCYSGHRVALVVNRAQKSVPDSTGEWPTFLPPPLESSSGTANADGPNSYPVNSCVWRHRCWCKPVGLWRRYRWKRGSSSVRMAYML